MFGIEDPSNLLQPWKNVKQFSEELYGMFTRSQAPAAAAQAPDSGATQPQAAPAPKPRDDPAGVGLGGVRKQRLAGLPTTLPGVPDPGKSVSPDDPRRTPPEGDQGTRRAVPTVESLVTPGLGPQPDRKPQASGTPRPSTATPYSDADHSATARVGVSQSGISDPTPRNPGASFRAKDARAANPESYAPGQPPPVAARRADEPGKGEPYKPPASAAKQGPDPGRVRETPPYKPVLDIGDFPGPPSAGGGTTVFMGKVDSGSGDTYQVFLYQSGPKGAADATPVEVTIPMIDPSDQIPPGTWLNPIFQFPGPPDEFGNPGVGFSYACQPPVWMP